MTSLTRSTVLSVLRGAWRRGFSYPQSYLITSRHHSHHHHDDHHNDHHHHSISAQHLTTRGLIEISGSQSPDFLQGLISNDITHLNASDENSSLYAGLLNAQGRLLYDLLLYKMDTNTYWIECDLRIVEELVKTLKRYRLRKKIGIEDMTEGVKIWSLFRDITNKTMEEPDFIDQKFNLVFAADPRLKAFGWRLILPEHTRMENTVRNALEIIDEDVYTIERYKVGIAEGVDELPPGKALPLECNFNFLHGVSFTKGCFIGQELTARTYNTGVTRKRLMPIEFSDSEPSIGAKVKTNDQDVGAVRAVSGKFGLALLRIGNLTSRAVKVEEDGMSSDALIRVPPWWPLGDPELKKVGFSLT